VAPNYVKVKTKIIRILNELINLEDVNMFEALFKNINEQILKRNMLETY
jgi:hypothetical protein